MKVLFLLLSIAFVLVSAEKDQKDPFVDMGTIVTRLCRESSQAFIPLYQDMKLTMHEEKVLRKHFAWSKIIFKSAQGSLFWHVNKMLTEMLRNSWVSKQASGRGGTCRDDSRTDTLQESAVMHSGGEMPFNKEGGPFYEWCFNHEFIHRSVQGMYGDENRMVLIYLQKIAHLRNAMREFFVNYKDRAVDSCVTILMNNVLQALLPLFSGLSQGVAHQFSGDGQDAFCHRHILSQREMGNEGEHCVHGINCACQRAVLFRENVFAKTGVIIPSIKNSAQERAVYDIDASVRAYFYAAKNMIVVARVLYNKRSDLRRLRKRLWHVRKNIEYFCKIKKRHHT